MKKGLLFIALVVVSLALHTDALAQKEKPQPLQEVFQGEVVYPQEKGELQITTGLNLLKSSLNGYRQIPIGLEYGITDKWQVGVQWSALRSNRSNGISQFGAGDIEIGTKYSFMDIADSNLHVAVGFELNLPTGHLSKGMSEGLSEYEPYVVVAKDFPGLKNLQIFTQVGLTLVQETRNTSDPDDEEPAAHELRLTSGFFIPFRHFCITTEFNWETNRWNNGGVENGHSLTPGLVWQFPGKLEMGIGTPISLGRTSSDSKVILRLTREF